MNETCINLIFKLQVRVLQLRLKQNTFLCFIIVLWREVRKRERERVKKRSETQRNETQRTRYDSTMVTYGNNMNDDLHSTQQQFQFVKRLLQDDNNETEFTSSNTTTTNDIVPGEGTGNSTMAPSMVPISSPTTATSPASSPTAYDNNEKTSFPISSPSYSMDYPAVDRYSPTAATDDTTNDTSINYTNIVMNPFYGTIIACTIGIIIIFIAWKFCKRWKSRRERQMLRLQSSRVDAVLGDMQVRLFSYIYMGICIYIYLLYD